MERIALDKIKSGKYQMREETDFFDLVESMKQNGFLDEHPLVVVKNGKQYELLCGHRRKNAALACGHEEVPCVVVEADDTAAHWKAFMDNFIRNNLTEVEQAKFLAKRMEEEGLSSRDIADRIGRAHTYVNQLLKLQELSPELQSMVIKDARGKEGISSTIAKLVADKVEQDKQAEFIEKVKELKLNTSEVKSVLSSGEEEIEIAVQKSRIEAPFKKFEKSLDKIGKPVDEETKKRIKELLDELTEKVNALLT